MGRRSKLTEKQWSEISARVLNGESARALAKEFGVSASAVHGKIPVMHAKLKSVAKQIVETEQALAELPISEQISARKLADDMRAISTNLAGAGKLGSIVARGMMEIAERQLSKVNRDDPMESSDILQGIAAVGRVANESSSIGMKLLATAAKDVKDNDIESYQPVTVRIVGRRPSDPR